MHDIRESDWKKLRQLKPVALERLCNQILSEIQEQCASPDKNAHERYLQVYSTVDKRDKIIARIFNDLRRSNGLIRLALMASHKLVTAEELADFSPEALAEVEFFSDR